MIDRMLLWENIAAPSYHALCHAHKEFISDFARNLAPLLTRVNNDMVNIDETPSLRDKVKAADLSCDDMAFIARVIVYYSLWCPDDEAIFEENGAWWKLGIAFDYLLSEAFRASGKRWGDQLLFDNRNERLSLACDLDIRQGIFFKGESPLGPANEKTLDIYLGHLAEGFSEKEAVNMTFIKAMNDKRWQPWLEAMNNVP